LWSIGFAESNLIVLKIDSFKALFLEWVTNQVVVCEGQSVGTAEDNGRVAVLLEYSPHLMQLAPVRGRESQPRDALDNQVVLGQSACLVEAANVDLACHWDAVRLRAEDLLLHELDD